MSARARHERQIARYQATFDFEDAVTTLAFENGVAWFTDEQIADIRSLMIKREWGRRVRMNNRRAAFAAARQQTKETV